MSSNRRAAMLIVIALAVLASLVLHLWGIERDLPDALEVDEIFLFRPAMNMVSDGNLDPGWFGYPASTVIYPLAALLHVQQAAFHGGRWLAADPKMRIEFAFAGDFAHYVRTGRLLSIAYGVASVALAAAIAWACFGAATAMAAAVLAAFSPVAIEYAQTLRSDSAATFFGLAFLTLLLRVRAAPVLRRQVLAGGALGLAIASRYMMASAGLVLAVVHLQLLSTAPVRRAALRGVVVAWLAVGIAFFVATSYMLLDARRAWRGLAVAAQKQSVHVGIDQLGFAGNLGFYLGEALPQAVGWPQYLLVLLGCAAALWQRDRRALLLPLYAVSCIVGVSLLGIHWQRWAMPVLPVLAILAARALVGATEWAAAARPGAGRRAALAAAAAVATLGVTWLPAQEAIANARRNALPSTQIAALDWVIANVPDGAHVACEWYAAPLEAGRARVKRFQLLKLPALGRRPLDAYYRDGWEYLLVSTHMYERFTRDPEHHPTEAAFYRRLRETGELLHEVAPTEDVRGPRVSIFRLPAIDGSAPAGGENRR